MDKIATPGSALAIAQGCTCPVQGNRRGPWWISDDCPLHGKQGADMPEEVDKS
jgi:hypothetical protein